MQNAVNLSAFIPRLQFEEAKWDSELKNLQDTQRLEFRNWIE